MPIPVALPSKVWVWCHSIAGMRVRVPPKAWISVSCECYVFSGRGRLCDRPITRPEESCVWCAWAWPWNLNDEEVLVYDGCRAMGKERKVYGTKLLCAQDVCNRIIRPFIYQSTSLTFHTSTMVISWVVKQRWANGGAVKGLSVQ
jgi:hypothetical protein